MRMRIWRRCEVVGWGDRMRRGGMRRVVECEIEGIGGVRMECPVGKRQ